MFGSIRNESDQVENGEDCDVVHFAYENEMTHLPDNQLEERRKSGYCRVTVAWDTFGALLLVCVFVWSCAERKCTDAATLIPATFDRRPQKWNRISKEEEATSTQKTLVAQLPQRVLCWILTVADSEEHRTKTKAIKETWGKRCDKLLFVSGERELKLGRQVDDQLQVPLEREGRDQLWRKVIEAFEYIHSSYLNEFDWFMKADDDTYVFVDSLKAFLANKRLGPNYTESVYFGHRFAPFVHQGYMSGGK